MELRPSKEDDQENIDRAFNILKDVIKAYPRIEPTVWAAAIWSCLVDGYANSGVSYEEFCDEWYKVKEHYKNWFDK